MPRVRHYTVDVQVHGKVAGVSDSGGELTHGEAVEQVVSQLRRTLGHIITIASVNVTETTIGGTPLATATIPNRKD